MPRPSLLPSPFGDSPFAVAEALRHEIGRGRLRSSDLQSPIWGVRVPTPGELTLEHLTAATARFIKPDTAFSHDTAAHLMDLPMPRPWDHTDAIHITRHTSKPRTRRRGIVAHRGLEHRDVAWFGGLACVNPANTWADLAAALSLDDLVVLGDAVAHWERGIPSTSSSWSSTTGSGAEGSNACARPTP